MKRVKLLKALRKGPGYAGERERGPHTTVYAKCGASLQVPRHRDIAPGTTRSVVKRAEKIGLIKKGAILVTLLFLALLFLCLMF